MYIAWNNTIYKSLFPKILKLKVLDNIYNCLIDTFLENITQLVAVWVELYIKDYDVDVLALFPTGFGGKYLSVKGNGIKWEKKAKNQFSIIVMIKSSWYKTNKVW